MIPRQISTSLFRISFCLTVHPSICLYAYLWLYSPLLDLGRFPSFLILYTDGRATRTGDQPVPRRLPIQNKRTQTSIPWVGFEPTIPAFERAKRVDASARGHGDRPSSTNSCKIPVLTVWYHEEWILHSKRMIFPSQTCFVLKDLLAWMCSSLTPRPRVCYVRSHTMLRSLGTFAWHREKGKVGRISTRVRIHERQELGTLGRSDEGAGMWLICCRDWCSV
jgi:hypothetical protein